MFEGEMEEIDSLDDTGDEAFGRKMILFTTDTETTCMRNGTSSLHLYLNIKVLNLLEAK